ncbi:MAG: efflux RND transporter periplasmic adaptor subunit, partial [Gammaproteobacteria bacterium]
MSKRTWIPAVITLVLGLTAGYWWADTGTRSVDDKPAQSSARKILFYRNPMNPEVTSPVPAQDGMGMDYIPVYADDDAGTGEPAGTVKIDPTTVQNIGVRTAIVKRGTISKTIRTVGRVDYDEERLARLHPKTEGWIEEL